MFATCSLHAHRPGRLIARLVALAVVCGLASGAAARAAWCAETPRDGLVLEYRFEGNAADSSGSHRDGTLAGQPRFVPGRTGQCVELDGRGTYIECGTTFAELGQTFTIECWVNPAAQQHLYADLFGNHGHGGYGFAVEQDKTNANRFYFGYGAGGGQWILTRAIQLMAGKWQHLAVVKTANDTKFYLNGVPVAVTKNSTPMLPSPNMLRVGDSINDAGRCFQGKIDEFRVWNKALTQFDLGFTPEEKLAAFAQVVTFRCAPVEPDRGAVAGQPAWQFAFDEALAPCLPAEVTEFVLELAAEDWRGGEAMKLPALHLPRAAGFRAMCRAALQPGFYAVHGQPWLTAA